MSNESKDDTEDPVLIARRRAARLASWGKRLGYSLNGLSLVVFVVGLIAGFSEGVARVVVFAVVVGSILLAPAIIISYAVRAAIRDERNR